MKYLQPLVLARTVKHPRYRLGVGDWVLEILNPLRVVGVDVRGPTHPDVPDSGVECSGDLSQHVVLVPPKWQSLLWLDAELAATLETDAPLVELNLVGQWSGRALWRFKVGVIGDRFRGCPMQGPLGPLFGRPLPVPPLPCGKVVMQRGVSVLNRAEKT